MIREPQIEVMFVGWAAITFFGFAGCFVVKRLVHYKPLLIVNRDGVFDNASAFGIGMVHWSEIERCVISNMNGHRFVGFILKEPDVILARQNLIKRWVLTMSKAMTSTPCNVPEILLPFSAEELIEKIDRIRRDCPSQGNVPLL